MDQLVAGHFQVKALVGQGAFGDVYRTVDLRSGRTVALKRLREDVVDETVVDRFEREGHLLSRIESPHVVRLLDRGHYEGRPWLALEWLDGLDLAARQSTDPLRLRQVVEVVRQAALGLEAMHAEGIVHRDIKPSNFFVEEREGSLRAVLIDLGVARARADSLLTTAGMRIGTPAYMSPEQASGDEEVGPSSDLYGLGVVLFELITGQRPFASQDALALLAKIVLDRPPLLRRKAPEIPEALEAIVDRLLGKEPADRPGSAKEVAALLGALEVPDVQTAAAEAEMPTAAEAHGGRPSFVEYRIVTTLFADFSEDTSRARIEEAGERAGFYGADVHRLLGRRFVAVFGSTRSSGDEAPRAAHAALAIRDLCPGARVAIATGRAFAERSGVSGELLDRGAAELEEAGRRVLVDEPTAKDLLEHFDLEKGERSWVLHGERSHSTAAKPRLLGRTTMFLEREHELEMLEDVFRDSAEQRRPAVAIVEAPPGMGKSRLRFELLERTGDDDATVLLLRCDPTLTAVPFGVLTHALRAMAKVEAVEDVEARRETLRAWGARIGFEGDRDLLVELARIGGDPSERVVSLREDPSALGPALRSAAEALFAALARDRPLRIVIEDVQWADQSTIEALAWSLDSLQDRPIATLVLARPRAADDHPNLFAATRPVRLTLRPLSNRAAKQMARALLGNDFDPAQLDRIARQAGGNPLFLEELIRSTAEQQRELPVAIQSAFQVRLDALPPSAKRTVLAASVLGRSVWAEALAALLPGQESGLNIDVLTHWEVLADRPRSRFPGTRELVFRHALLQEVAYAMLGAEDRAQLHGRAARWLAEAGERDPVVLAQHHGEAGEVDRATELYAEAARAALREGALTTALEHVQRALEGELTEAERARMLLVAANACHRLGRYDQALEHCDEAQQRLPGTTTALRLAATKTRLLRRMGRMQEGIALATARLRELDEPSAGESADAEHTKASCELRAELAWTLYNGGHLPLALRIAEGAQQSCDSDAPAMLAITTSLSHVTGRALHGLGRLEESLAMHRETVERACAAGHLWRGEGARHGLGQVLLALGRIEESIRELREAARAGRSLRMPSTEGYAHLYLALAERAGGDLERAAESAARARELGDQLGAPMLRAGAQATAATIALEQGDAAGAEELAREGEAIHRAPAGWSAANRGALSLALAREGRHDEALRLAEDVARDLGGPTTVDEGFALARASASLAFRELGDDDAADALAVD